MTEKITKEEWARRMRGFTSNLRKIIDRAEVADKPYARDPLIQRIKEFSNEIDVWTDHKIREK